MILLQGDCDFDSASWELDCMWHQSLGEDGTWQQSGGSSIPGIGPAMDHTLGTAGILLITIFLLCLLVKRLFVLETLII